MSTEDDAIIQALRKPGVLLFLDGRNEHGSHVLPMPMQTADFADAEEDLSEAAEAIIRAAEAIGYPVGSAVWCEFSRVKGQYDGMGRCELQPGWEFESINIRLTEAFGFRYDDAAAASPKPPGLGD